VPPHTAFDFRGRRRFFGPRLIPMPVFTFPVPPALCLLSLVLFYPSSAATRRRFSIPPVFLFLFRPPQLLCLLPSQFLEGFSFASPTFPSSPLDTGGEFLIKFLTPSACPIGGDSSPPSLLIFLTRVPAALSAPALSLYTLKPQYFHLCTSTPSSQVSIFDVFLHLF